MSDSPLGGTYRLAKRVVISVVGATLLLLGFVMLITPGPGLVAIAGGLAILAVEFAWARVWLARVRRKISEASGSVRGRAAERHRDSGS
ncbi:MAG: PGPGW domain-containing protein [Woeseiaceae bacterium]